jgi:signal transduction histidine kinase
LLRAPEDEPGTEPLPRLADVERLVDRVRGAGVPIELEVGGERRRLSDGAELSAYRIVQESLTNAVRHGGPGVSVTVTITFTPDRLEVSVDDNGRGASSGGTADGGHGIVGMRERIAVLGGEFNAAPKPGGGYLVRAIIPFET